MGFISKLPAAVVNQIAAGEVIERPASVVKELLENALDAGATRIVVSVEQGGRSLICVQDNGCGMAADDLPLAVASHATSKLRTADDLLRVQTLGFRGEALASIASVGHLRMQSRSAGETAGAQIEVTGSEVGPVSAVGCPPGTRIEVRNLFYNAPVRRRFLKSTGTEMGHIAEAFTRVALAQSHLGMVLQHNERTMFDLPPCEQLSERLAIFFGSELAENLIRVESEDEGCRLWGYVADPSQSRSDGRSQYLFVNRRYVRDRSLFHALREAYRGLLMVGRYPIAFLFLDMAPEQLDVNVHPTKIEVRFCNPHQHYNQLLATLREKFLHSDLHAHLQVPAWQTGGAADRGQPNRVRESLNAFFENAAGAKARSEPPAWPREPQSGLPSSPQPPFRLRPPAAGAETPGLPFAQAAGAPAAPPEAQGESRDREAGGAVTAGPLEATSTPLNAMQVHDSYLVVETHEGMMVIDQHALHERILYEQLRDRVLGEQLELQRLLVPEMVELSAAEAGLVGEELPVLAQLGLEVEPFGGTTLALHTVPAMLAHVSAAQMLCDLSEELITGARTPDRRDLLDKLMHRMACKAAVKAGQRLTDGEIRALLAGRHLAQDAHHCPHGRPTALLFTKKELERQFKRI